MLTELVRWSVNSVAGAQRRGEDEARHKCRATSRLQRFSQDVRGIRPDVGTEELFDRRLGEFFEVFDELLARVTPGKVRIGLGKPKLCQAIHDLRPRKRLGQKNELRVLPLQLADHPFPEGKGLGVRVVDSEDVDPMADPELEYALELFPQLTPLRRLKIDGIDVLVLLRWVLGVLNRAISAMAKPFRMLADPWMVRRGLERDIQRDLDATRLGHGNQTVEVLDSAQLGMNVFVTT